MSGKTVLSIGQCGLDHGNITRRLHTQFSALVVPASSSQEAIDRLRRESFALVLVNRIFDADGESGLDFIRDLKSDPELQNVPVMLVSNFPEAQEEAIAAGAVPGFGKAALHDVATMDRLRPFLT